MSISKKRKVYIIKDKDIIIAYLKRYRSKVIKYDINFTTSNYANEVLNRYFTIEEFKNTINENATTRATIDTLNLLIDRIDLHGLEDIALYTLFGDFRNSITSSNLTRRQFGLVKNIGQHQIGSEFFFINDPFSYEKALEKLKKKREMKSLERALNRYAIEELEDEVFKL